MKKINRYISLLMSIPVSITGFIPNSPEWLLYLRVFLLGVQTWALVNYAYQEIKGE